MEYYNKEYNKGYNKDWDKLSMILFEYKITWVFFR
jgi:hypothetical protein